jgi:hypothetical protein
MLGSWSVTAKTTSTGLRKCGIVSLSRPGHAATGGKRLPPPTKAMFAALNKLSVAMWIRDMAGALTPFTDLRH